MLRTPYRVPSTQYSVPGTQYPILSPQYPVLRAQHSAMRTRGPAGRWARGPIGVSALDAAGGAGRGGGQRRRRRYSPRPRGSAGASLAPRRGRRRPRRRPPATAPAAASGAGRRPTAAVVGTLCCWPWRGRRPAAFGPSRPGCSTTCRRCASITSATSTRWTWSSGPCRWAGGRSSGRCPASGDVLMSKHLRSAARRLAAARLRRAAAAAVGRLAAAVPERAEDAAARALPPAARRRRSTTWTCSRRTCRSAWPRRSSSRNCWTGSSSAASSRWATCATPSRGTTSSCPTAPAPADFLRGDALLRADRRLAVALDGVYHRGEFYLRWMQRFSLLAFGTRTGRFLTRYLAMPFGGAYLVLAGLEHLVDDWLPPDTSCRRVPLSWTLGCHRYRADRCLWACSCLALLHVPAVSPRRCGRRQGRRPRRALPARRLPSAGSIRLPLVQRIYTAAGRARLPLRGQAAACRRSSSGSSCRREAAAGATGLAAAHLPGVEPGAQLRGSAATSRNWWPIGSSKAGIASACGSSPACSGW